MDPAPHVCALVTAYDCAAFVDEAVESALGQDYPAERLSVLVVDDGSRDGTAERLAEQAARHPRRVRVVTQPNGGYIAATNRALAEARGDVFALLDGDDAWPPDKIRRQVDALTRLDVGLVYGDMTVIDAHGRVLEESWLEGEQPPEGRPFAALMAGNPATSSSILLRADLARRLAPVPAAVHFADWYLALRAAQTSEIAYLPEPRTLYRFHGANMGLGARGPRREAQLRKSLELQRWFLRRLRPGDVAPEDAHDAWRSFERFAVELQKEAGTPFVTTVTVSDDDRAEARTLLAEARALAAEVTLLVAAAACDPWCAAPRELAALAAS